MLISQNVTFQLAKKIKSVILSGGAEGSDRLWTGIGEKFGIMGINFIVNIYLKKYTP